MIGLMAILAVIVGILVGLFCYSRQTISWILIVLHTAAFRSKQNFYQLYDAADDETSFKFYRTHNKTIEKYADYLKLHAKARDSAYGVYQNTIRGLKKSLVKVFLISLVPSALFWSNWHYYLLGVVIVLVALILREIVKNGTRPGYYQRLAVFNVLNTYAKSAVPED